MGDVEVTFLQKKCFWSSEVKVVAKTVIDKYNSGEWTDLEGLKQYVNLSFDQLKTIVEKQTDEDWETTITTKEFGTKTRQKHFGRIVSYTTLPITQVKWL